MIGEAGADAYLLEYNVLFELALARQTQSLVTMNVTKMSDRFNSQLCRTYFQI